MSARPRRTRTATKTPPGKTTAGRPKSASAAGKSASALSPAKRLAAAEARVTELSAKLRSKNAQLKSYSQRLRESEMLAQSAGDALQASLDREKLTLAFAEIGTCELDLRTRTVRASEMALRLFGFRAGQTHLPFETLLSVMHPEDRPRFEQVVLQCIEGTGSLDIEYRVAEPGGAFRWLRTKGDALLDFEGEPLKVLWVTEDISQRRDTDARVRFLAHHDLLTGLPNRTLFQDRLQQAIAAANRMQTRVALLFIDVDRFKAINDSFGHRAGDTLLQGVAARLRRCVRETDTVCRHSGDEYLIVLSALHESSEAAVVANKVMQAIEEPFTLENQSVSVSVSIGISIYPEHGLTIEDLIRDADAAMYFSKQNGRKRFEFFDPQLMAPAADRLSLANELRRGIERGELMLHFQPQFDVASGNMLAAEALVRWNHPERGELQPEQFIRVAEESDLIHLVDEWVLNQTCAFIAQWLQMGLNVVPVAVNLSAMQFQRGGLVETVAGALARHGVQARYLELELTENAIMLNPRETARTLESLHRMGIVLSIDDFGTGYSSINYLKRFAIDKLKIDRSFVSELPDDLNDAAIVQAVVSLARSLQLKVVAEGVETQAQLDFLRAVGCEAYQGFLSARPEDTATFQRLIG